MRFEAAAGTDYLIAVDGVNGAQGNIVLNWGMGTAPVITNPPTNQTVNAGGTATISVQASGKPVPSYQWQFNGRDIPGATNTVLTLTNVQPAHAGSYRVVANNFIDKVVSAPAFLSVAQQQLILKPGSAVISNGAFRLVIEGSGAQSVVIEANTSLCNPSGWTPLWTNSPGSSEFIDTAAYQHPLRFYRARFTQ